MPVPTGPPLLCRRLDRLNAGDVRTGSDSRSPDNLGVLDLRFRAPLTPARALGGIAAVALVDLLNRNLYDKYHFDEPWDGPRNRQLLEEIRGDPYRCPDDPRSADDSRKWTSYVAVLGPRTMWPGGRGRKLSVIPDGTSNTVIVVEDHSSQIAWMEPRDLEVEEAQRLFASVDPQADGLHRRENFFFVFRWGRMVACADGSVHFVEHEVKRDDWSALLTVDDGVKPVVLEASGLGREIRRVKLGNCFRLAVFVLLVVLPFPWVWHTPRPRSKSAPERSG